MTVKKTANVCATTASPPTAKLNQIASPIHIAAKNGRMLRKPSVRTLATRAAILGPGEPAATSNVNAKAINAAAVTADLPVTNKLYHVSWVPAPGPTFIVSFEG
jgi:hypothetical protein